MSSSVSVRSPVVASSIPRLLPFPLRFVGCV
jgi:hypothetical protein